MHVTSAPSLRGSAYILKGCWRGRSNPAVSVRLDCFATLAMTPCVRQLFQRAGRLVLAVTPRADCRSR